MADDRVSARGGFFFNGNSRLFSQWRGPRKDRAQLLSFEREPNGRPELSLQIEEGDNSHPSRLCVNLLQTGDDSAQLFVELFHAGLWYSWP
jgi:hypothetical protein